MAMETIMNDDNERCHDGIQRCHDGIERCHDGLAKEQKRGKTASDDMINPTRRQKGEEEMWSPPLVLLAQILKTVLST